MNDFLLYLLKANLILALLYGFYVLLLRRDTFYGYHRWYLLATLLAALLLPLVDFSGWFRAEEVRYVPSLEEMLALLMMQNEVSATPVVVQPAVSVSWTTALLWAVMAVSGVLLVARLGQMVGVVGLYFRSSRRWHGGQAIQVVDKPIQPFSFFRWIFLPHNRLDEAEIVAHEQIHCRQWHSADIMLSEMAVCLFWYNPVAWLLRNELKQNLEYYTDRQMLERGFERKLYQYKLLEVSGNVCYSLVNNFYFNPLKKRIMKMNEKKTPRILAAKYLLAIPVLLATMLAVRASGVEEVVVSNSVTIEQDPPVVTEQKMTEAEIEAVKSAKQGDSIVVTEVCEQVDKPAKGADKDADVVVIRYGENKKADADVKVRERECPADKEEFIRVTAKGWDSKNPPLVMIDGVVVDEVTRKNLNSDDIASISILKGESAIKQYGDKGKDGVILITMKKK